MNTFAKISFVFVFIFFVSFVPPLAQANASRESGTELLSIYMKAKKPWLDLPANSEQRQPIYLGATPRELEFNLRPVDNHEARILQSLLDLGVVQIKAVQAAMLENGILDANQKNLDLEVWPVRNDRGQLTWTIARWRLVDANKWNWLDENDLKNFDAIKKLDIKPFLSKIYYPSNKEDHSKIFDDALKMQDLYDKPLFSDCVWSSVDQGTVLAAWLPVEGKDKYTAQLRPNTICRYLPQPVRLNGKATSFIVRLTGDKIAWPNFIIPAIELTQLPPVTKSERAITKWPEDFIDSYMKDIRILSGAETVTFKQGRKETTVRFTKKNSAEKDHQLELMADYFEGRYKELKIPTERFRFKWLGLPQSNVIAKIQGSNKGAANKPILLADHFDTAFCQDVYDATKGIRASAAGADDNYSASAALLRAASIFKNMKFKNDIWLVHITGEEFPADDLGARKLVSQLLKTKKDIGGLVLLDMIGHREKNDDMIFQVNPGDSLESLKMAAVAMDAAKSESTFTPVLRTRFDAKGYLYNTDGLIFSDNGFPVVYFNEHINYEEHLERIGYHDTKDTVDGRPADFLVQDIPSIERKQYHAGIDSKYATDIAKIAIETVARLAQ